MLRKLICAALALALFLGCAQAMDRERLRAAWQEVTAARTQDSPYAEEPDLANFAPGSLTQAAQADALAMVNFARELAGLQPVRLDELYTLRAQLGALILAANDQLSHEPAQPAGMPDALYQSGFTGTSMGNVASFNWMRPDILIDAVTGFLRDDGEINLARLGHRRWVLNPCMAATGFGLANAASGNSYAVMYAVDMDNADAQWDYVAWPCAGAFPVELMRAPLPWSISLNPERCDLANSSPLLMLTERVSGASFRFDFASETGDGACHINTERCGSGDCLIFLPALADANIDEYEQNQVWEVALTGLVAPDGSEQEIHYVCEMVSVYPQDAANVELNVTEAKLAPGKTLQLVAAVIPSWADDLSVTWRLSDASVATMDASGLVTALAPGVCEIVAETSNGRSDVCVLTVEE